MAPVDLVDDVQVARQEVLEEVYRPALQSLWQDGVVSVGTGTHSDVPSLQGKKRHENICRIGSRKHDKNLPLWQNNQRSSGAYFL